VKLVPDLVAKYIIAPQKKIGKVYRTNLPLCMPLTHIGLEWCSYTLSLTSELDGDEWKNWKGLSYEFAPVHAINAYWVGMV
jgi:hypothetical protein